MANKLHLEPETFQGFMDAMTKWQRVAILMKFKLAELGVDEAELTRLMLLTKEQASDELERYVDEASARPEMRRGAG